MVPITGQLRVKYVPVGDVHPYEDNPRRNDGAVQAVANSLREFGWKQPIVVDADGTIIAGHTRYKAALALEMTHQNVLVFIKGRESDIKSFGPVIADGDLDGVE